MQDNGLLKYYRQKHARESGKLRLSTAPFKLNLEYYDGYGTVRAMYDNNQKYFFKFVDKREVDAEVLLSQVYAKAGFTTAIYTPLDPVGVISQRVDDDSCKIAKKFFMSKASQNIEGFSKEDKKLIKENMVPTAYRVFENYKDLFTPECVRDYLKMKIFDVASNNSDRNMGNYFVRENEEGLGGELLLIDYGGSGNPFRPPKFYSSLDGDVISTKQEIFDSFKNKEVLHQFVNVSELAEQIGGVDVVGVATDIKQTINYEVDKTFVDKIATSMEQTAETLIK